MKVGHLNGPDTCGPTFLSVIRCEIARRGRARAVCTGAGSQIENALRLLDGRQVKTAIQDHGEDVMAVGPDTPLANQVPRKAMDWMQRTRSPTAGSACHRWDPSTDPRRRHGSWALQSVLPLRCARTAR